MKLKLLLLIAALILFGTNANAQSNNILVTITPPNPAPFENVTITLNSYVYNLDSVLISWSAGGAAISTASGTGKKTFSTTAPAAGAESNITATIHLPDGLVQQRMTIRPSVMVLLWQANDSYVPPFYKGKALAAPDSEVKVVAMPEIRTISGLVDSKNMTYAWKKDYTNNVDGSGFGKNFFLFINDYLEDSNTVSVAASTTDQNYSSQASIDIGMAQPKIVFYKKDSVLGTLFDQALPNPYRIQGAEIVEAIPYFISPKEIRTPTLIWNWFINNGRVELASFKKNLMPIGVSEGTHGTSILRLNIQNEDKIFQSTTKEINIEF